GRRPYRVADDVAVLARRHPACRLDQLGVPGERPHREGAALRPPVLVEKERVDAAVGAGGEAHRSGRGKLGNRKGTPPSSPDSLCPAASPAIASNVWTRMGLAAAYFMNRIVQGKYAASRLCSRSSVAFAVSSGTSALARRLLINQANIF